MRTYHGRVLCFHFDTDQFEAGTYCDKIKNVFSQGFGFRVAASILPSKTFAQRDMHTALEEAFDGMDSDCLVIIYYIGRGEVRHQLEDAQLWMQGRQQINEQTPDINFNTVRETAIDHQPAKVLMLLDTCHGAGGSIGQYKEIIEACYKEHSATPGVFTDHLVDELTQAAYAKNLVTTAQLWTNLARRHVTPNNMELANIPWFIAEIKVPNSKLRCYYLSTLGIWASKQTGTFGIGLSRTLLFRVVLVYTMSIAPVPPLLSSPSPLLLKCGIAYRIIPRSSSWASKFTQHACNGRIVL